MKFLKPQEPPDVRRDLISMNEHQQRQRKPSSTSTSSRDNARRHKKPTRKETTSTSFAFEQGQEPAPPPPMQQETRCRVDQLLHSTGNQSTPSPRTRRCRRRRHRDEDQVGAAKGPSVIAALARATPPHANPTTGAVRAELTAPAGATRGRNSLHPGGPSHQTRSPQSRTTSRRPRRRRSSATSTEADEADAAVRLFHKREAESSQLPHRRHLRTQRSVDDEARAEQIGGATIPTRRRRPRTLSKTNLLQTNPTGQISPSSPSDSTTAARRRGREEIQPRKPVLAPRLSLAPLNRSLASSAQIFRSAFRYTWAETCGQSPTHRRLKKRTPSTADLRSSRPSTSSSPPPPPPPPLPHHRRLPRPER
jgi:hypothetical protein